jgi:hypothetical protein
MRSPPALVSLVSTVDYLGVTIHALIDDGSKFQNHLSV